MLSLSKYQTAESVDDCVVIVCTSFMNLGEPCCSECFFSSSANCLKANQSAMGQKNFARNKDKMPPNCSRKLAWCGWPAWGCCECITFFFPSKYAAIPVPVFTCYEHRPHRCSHDDEDVSVRLMELFIVVELLPQLPKDLGAREGNVGHFL